jgi:hypothetical protein
VLKAPNPYGKIVIRDLQTGATLSGDLPGFTGFPGFVLAIPSSALQIPTSLQESAFPCVKGPMKTPETPETPESYPAIRLMK